MAAVKTKKSFYYCEAYKNSIDYLADNEELVREPRLNFDLDYLFNKWKEKAIRRAQNLKTKNKFKREITCQIIREL